MQINIIENLLLEHKVNKIINRWVLPKPNNNCSFNQSKKSNKFQSKNHHPNFPRTKSRKHVLSLCWNPHPLSILMKMNCIYNTAFHIKEVHLLYLCQLKLETRSSQSRSFRIAILTLLFKNWSPKQTEK